MCGMSEQRRQTMCWLFPGILLWSGVPEEGLEDAQGGLLPHEDSGGGGQGEGNGSHKGY